MNAEQALKAGAETFKLRNAAYGNNYKLFGRFMVALFGGKPPQLQTEEDWSRLGVYIQCVSKLSRYAQQWHSGGHKDSAHDLMVYAAMLEELTCSSSTPKPPA